MDASLTLAVWVAGIAAGLAGLGYIARKTIQGVRIVLQLGRKLEVLADIASYELQHNGGRSIKDAVTKIPGIETALNEHLKESVEQKSAIDARFQALETQQSKTIADLAEALPVVAKSHPPEEST